MDAMLTTLEAILDNNFGGSWPQGRRSIFGCEGGGGGGAKVRKVSKKIGAKLQYKLKLVYV